MTKSSSSSKKLKHSRDSSKLLRSVKKKKTKRNKSKKIKDCSDESEFSGSDSSLYSSSEDDYRRKKRRSKVSKKKSRKRYSSSESDDSDDDRLLKKKKRSKRKNERVGKKKEKKIISRKRRKRDLSSSSGSFQDNQSDGDSESDGKRRTRDRGRSKDELVEGNEPDRCWQVEDKVMTQKNSRRLKSIVVVSYTYDNDHKKEDIVDDHDDESDEDKYVDDERDREARHSYSKTGADEYGRKTVDYDEFEEDIKSETSKSCLPDNSLKDDDLEAILKKRALENLKRFRGEIQRSGRAEEVFSVSEGEPLRIESEKVEESQDCVSVGIKDVETSHKVLQDANVKKPGTVLAEFASQEDQQPGETAKVKASSGISSCTTKRKLTRPVLGQDAEAGSINGSTIDQNCPESSLDIATKNGSETIDQNCPESSLDIATKNGSETIEPTKAVSTLRAESSSHADTETLDEIKGGSQSEQKTMDETKDESQYEQKTMTVMRGGEMVQVSYKVYIPKKTSSLGRRQLKR